MVKKLDAIKIYEIAESGNTVVPKLTMFKKKWSGQSFFDW